MPTYYRSSLAKWAGILCTLTFCFLSSTARLNAQSSGMLMTNGAGISTSGGQVSIAADSTTHRLVVINEDDSASALVVATWPCGTSGNQFGIPYSNTLQHTIYAETCLPTPVSGTGILMEVSGSAPTWGSPTGNTTVLATSNGTLTPGNVVTTDSNNNFISTASPLPGSTDTIRLYEEFESGNTTTIGSLGWTLTNVAGSQTVSYTPSSGTYPHLGIVRQATGTTIANGGTISLSQSTSNDQLGNLGTNTNWTATYIFELGQTTFTGFRIGLADVLNSRQPTDGYFLRFDTNAPTASTVATNGIVCTTSVCTLTTTAAHNMLLVGQTVGLTGVNACNSGRNGNHTVATIPSTTTYTFAGNGTAESGCGSGATSTPSAETTFKVDVRKGGASSGVSTTETVTGTSVTADTNWHKLVISSTTAGTIVFTLDGGTAIPVSTNVFSSGGLTAFETLVTDAAASKTVDWDLFTFSISGLGR